MNCYVFYDRKTGPTSAVRRNDILVYYEAFRVKVMMQILKKGFLKLESAIGT